jgi:hypothetical protein
MRIYMRPYSSNASIFGGTSGKDRPVFRHGSRWCYVYRIVAAYAIGEPFNQGPLFDLREVHHIDEDVTNWKPSNLVIAENRKQHKQLDLYARIAKIEGKPVTLMPNGAVPVGAIIRNDDYPLEIMCEWWLDESN